MIPVSGSLWRCEFCGTGVYVNHGVPGELGSCTWCMTRVVDCGDFRLLIKDKR